MRVFHGSNQIVQKPDIGHSYRPLDFGMGFYVTTVREQAIRWAERKSKIYNGTRPVLNIYEMADLPGNLSIKTFAEDLVEWINFVCQCRDGALSYKEYDVIMGKVANDKVFRVVDMYHSGIWDLDRALREIKVYPHYDQIAFISQKAIDSLLTFVSSEEV